MKGFTNCSSFNLLASIPKRNSCLATLQFCTGLRGFSILTLHRTPSFSIQNQSALTKSLSVARISTKRAFANGKEKASEPSSGLFGKFVLGGVLGSLFYFFGRPSAAYPAIENKSKFLQYFSRSKDKLADFFYGFSEPAFEKFLPDKPINDPHNRPLTLVIDLDQFLVCHFWDTKNGRWRVAKRPNIDMFLFYMAQYYELVLFSSMNQQEGEMILQKIDPYGCISYRLYRFATSFRHGKYYKDLKRLNRDLSKVIVFAPDDVGFSAHQENFLKVAPWDGDFDKQLDRYIDFFEALAVSKIDDVRPVIAKYRGLDVAETYDRVQQTLYDEMKAAYERQFQRRQRSILFRLFGAGKSTNGTSESSSTNGSSSIPTFAAKKDMLMELRQKEYEKAKRLMDEQIEKEKKKQEEHLKQNKLTMWDVAVNGPPQMPPPSDAPASV